MLAIGGITPARVPDVVRAGAAGIAAIGLFAAGGERELRDAVGQIRLAFGVTLAASSRAWIQAIVRHSSICFSRARPRGTSACWPPAACLPRPAHEQIALLVVLSDDPDPEIAAQANATIARLPREALTDFLATDVPPSCARSLRPEVREPAAVESDGAAGPVAARTRRTRKCARRMATDADGSNRRPVKTRHRTSPRLMSSLSIADRLKLATKGTREQRGQLIRDANRIVATAVLTSPKLTESEVEAFAKMGNVSEDVLRIIGTNRTWLKNYGIVHAVTRNPKTPPASRCSSCTG